MVGRRKKKEKKLKECKLRDFVPVANLFLLSDSLYPVPCRSMSTPDRVLPSFMNWTAKVEGVEGPLESSNLANTEPAPEVKKPTINCFF